MIQKLKALFMQETTIDSPEQLEKKLQHACAALLFEVIRADYEQTDSELKTVTQLLSKTFKLSNEELNELVEDSQQKNEENTSVYPYTTLINDHYDYDKRVNIIRLMWKVAFADGDLDKYEDNIIRKVADLLYVRHSDFIQAKLSEA